MKKVPLNFLFWILLYSLVFAIYINEEFLKAEVTDFSRHFYLCGPPKMVEVLTETLQKLGASTDSVVFEK